MEEIIDWFHSKRREGWSLVRVVVRQGFYCRIKVYIENNNMQVELIRFGTFL